MLGTLYLVSTPIGNLGDISFRAVEVLKSADMIACEDTRHTGRLLKHYGIKGRLVSYHDHNEAERADQLAQYLVSGKSVALVTDAGTPGIADPAFRAVAKAREIGAEITSVPGPAAFVSAVIVSGLPTDSVFFGGFLPSKKGNRIKRLRDVSRIPATLVFYETPHRIQKSLEDCVTVLGNRRAALVRELTKLHEETITGQLEEIKTVTESTKIRGELVLVIDRDPVETAASVKTQESAMVSRMRELMRQGIEQKKALRRSAKEFGFARSEAYRIYQTAGERTDGENT